MSSSINKGQIIKIALAAIVFLVLWFIPTAAIGLPNISIVEHRVIAIFALALILWFTEAIPSWKTSILIIVVLLLMCSDQALIFLQTDFSQLSGSYPQTQSKLAFFAREKSSSYFPSELNFFSIAVSIIIQSPIP